MSVQSVQSVQSVLVSESSSLDVGQRDSLNDKQKEAIKSIKDAYVKQFKDFARITAENNLLEQELDVVCREVGDGFVGTMFSDPDVAKRTFRIWVDRFVAQQSTKSKSVGMLG